MKTFAAATTILMITSSAFIASLAHARPSDQRTAPPTIPKIVITPALSNSGHPISIAVKNDPRSQTPKTEVNWDAPPVADLNQILIDDGIPETQADEYYALLVKTAKAANIPLDVLFASIAQESDYKHYGMNLDYGNYSCGVSQYNISGWCQSVNPSKALSAKFAWPRGKSCDDYENNNAKIMDPFLQAIQQAHPLPESGTEPQDFAALDKATIIAQMPGATNEAKAKQYQAAMSFGANCSIPQMGIYSMAKSLKQIYRDYLPKELKAAHPHTAWLIADAIYNIGPVLIDIIQQNSGSPNPWASLTPQRVIDLLGAIWMKRPAGATDTTTFSIKDSDGEIQHVKYFQACVNQRHITHIILAALPEEKASEIHSVTDDCGDLAPPQAPVTAP